MTTTTTYDPTTVPARGDDRSRFALPVSPTGINVTAPQAILLAYERLLADRRAEATPAPARTITLKKIAVTEGQYILLSGKTFTVEPNAEARYGSGRFAKRRTGGAWIDEVFLGDAFSHPRDEDIWQAACELAAQEGFTGRDLSRLNYVISCAILLRAGVTRLPPPWEIG